MRCILCSKYASCSVLNVHAIIIVWPRNERSTPHVTPKNGQHAQQRPTVKVAVVIMNGAQPPVADATPICQEPEDGATAVDCCVAEGRAPLLGVNTSVLGHLALSVLAPTVAAFPEPSETYARRASGKRTCTTYVLPAQAVVAGRAPGTAAPLEPAGSSVTVVELRCRWQATGGCAAVTGRQRLQKHVNHPGA